MEKHGGLPDPSKLGAAFDPRARITRNPFNELTLFVFSAAGAGVLVPTVLTVASVFTGKLAFLPFVALSVLLELGLIFLHLRPAMDPREWFAWALLWGSTAAILGAAFWELTYIQIL